MYKLSAGKDNSAFMSKDFQIKNGQVDSTVAVNHFATMFGK